MSPRGISFQKHNNVDNNLYYGYKVESQGWGVIVM